MAKSKEDIEQEYGQLCAALGESEFKRASLQEALTKLNDERNTIIQKIRNIQKTYKELAAVPTAPQAPDQSKMIEQLDLKTEETPSEQP